MIGSQVLTTTDVLDALTTQLRETRGASAPASRIHQNDDRHRSTGRVMPRASERSSAQPHEAILGRAVVEAVLAAARDEHAATRAAGGFPPVGFVLVALCVEGWPRGIYFGDGGQPPPVPVDESLVLALTPAHPWLAAAAATLVSTVDLSSDDVGAYRRALVGAADALQTAAFAAEAHGADAVVHGAVDPDGFRTLTGASALTARPILGLSLSPGRR